MRTLLTLLAVLLIPFMANADEGKYNTPVACMEVPALLNQMWRPGVRSWVSRKTVFILYPTALVVWRYDRSLQMFCTLPSREA